MIDLGNFQRAVDFVEEINVSSAEEKVSLMASLVCLMSIARID